MRVSASPLEREEEDEDLFMSKWWTRKFPNPSPQSSPFIEGERWFFFEPSFHVHFSRKCPIKPSRSWSQRTLARVSTRGVGRGHGVGMGLGVGVGLEASFRLRIVPPKPTAVPLSVSAKETLERQ